MVWLSARSAEPDASWEHCLAHPGFVRCIDGSRFCFGERTGSLRLTQTLPTHPYRYILRRPVPLRSVSSMKTSTQILLFPSCIVCMDASFCSPQQSDRKSRGSGTPPSLSSAPASRTMPCRCRSLLHHTRKELVNPRLSRLHRRLQRLLQVRC